MPLRRLLFGVVDSSPVAAYSGDSAFMREAYGRWRVARAIVRYELQLQLGCSDSLQRTHKQEQHLQTVLSFNGAEAIRCREPPARDRGTSRTSRFNEAAELRCGELRRRGPMPCCHPCFNGAAATRCGEFWASRTTRMPRSSFNRATAIRCGELLRPHMDALPTNKLQRGRSD